MRGSKAGRMWGRMGGGVGEAMRGWGRGHDLERSRLTWSTQKFMCLSLFFAIVEDRWARKLFNPPNPGQRQKFMCLSFFPQLSATAGHVNFGT